MGELVSEIPYRLSLLGTCWDSPRNAGKMRPGDLDETLLVLF